MTYDEAVEYMKRELGLPEPVIRGELNWYIQKPGYPLSYLYGKVRIKQIKEKIKKKLGARFDEAKFHKAILEEGTVYLDILERIVIEKLVGDANNNES